MEIWRLFVWKFGVATISTFNNAIYLYPYDITLDVTIKGFTIRNMQYMVQFFNEYNQELTMVKDAVSTITQSAIVQPDKGSETITKSVISQFNGYNFTLPIKHLDWTHNLILMKQVKDIRARYWYIG